MTALAKKECVPCKGGQPPLEGDQVTRLQREVPDWNVIDEHHLSRSIQFPDFVTALRFVDRVGELAEEQGHHPDIYLTWGRVRIEIWTHKIDGLTESDFILTAKINELPTN